MIGQPQEITGDKPVALYRLYDEADALLYVGITHSPHDRFGQHAKDKEWWPEVARKTVAWCADRKEAETAEYAAITSEKPRHNKASGTYPPSGDLAALRTEVARLTGRLNALDTIVSIRQRSANPEEAPRKSARADAFEATLRLAIRDQMAESIKDPEWVAAIVRRHREYKATQARRDTEHCPPHGDTLACPQCEPNLFPGHKTQDDHDQAAQATTSE